VSTAVAGAVAIDGLEVGAYEVPTDEPESDGTLAWDSTTIVVVHVRAGDRVGAAVVPGMGARLGAGRAQLRVRHLAYARGL